MPIEGELGYIAGQLDADGSICLVKGASKGGGVYLQRSVSIYSQDREMLEWIQDLLGGSIYKCGRVLAWKPKSRLEFLELIRPYLRTKRRQADLAIESSEIRMQMNHEIADEFVRRSKELNGTLPKGYK